VELSSYLRRIENGLQETASFPTKAASGRHNERHEYDVIASFVLESTNDLVFPPSLGLLRREDRIDVLSAGTRKDRGVRVHVHHSHIDNPLEPTRKVGNVSVPRLAPMAQAGLREGKAAAVSAKVNSMGQGVFGLIVGTN
jgi:hypothetical protein